MATVQGTRERRVTETLTAVGRGVTCRREGGGPLTRLLLYSPGGYLARGFHGKRRDEL